jgi:hypothetical protein
MLARAQRAVAVRTVSRPQSFPRGPVGGAVPGAAQSSLSAARRLGVGRRGRSVCGRQVLAVVSGWVGASNLPGSVASRLSARLLLRLVALGIAGCPRDLTRPVLPVNGHRVMPAAGKRGPSSANSIGPAAMPRRWLVSRVSSASRRAACCRPSARCAAAHADHAVLVAEDERQGVWLAACVPGPALVRRA